jgi:hypothetical protein
MGDERVARGGVKPPALRFMTHLQSETRRIHLKEGAGEYAEYRPWWDPPPGIAAAGGREKESGESF